MIADITSTKTSSGATAFRAPTNRLPSRPAAFAHSGMNMARRIPKNQTDQDLANQTGAVHQSEWGCCLCHQIVPCAPMVRESLVLLATCRKGHRPGTVAPSADFFCWIPSVRVGLPDKEYPICHRFFPHNH